MPAESVSKGGMPLKGAVAKRLGLIHCARACTQVLCSRHKLLVLIEPAVVQPVPDGIDIAALLLRRTPGPSVP